MHGCSKQGRHGHLLVELHDRIKGHQIIDDGFSEVGDAVATHGQQKYRETERHDGGGATRHTDPVTKQPADAKTFKFHGVVWTDQNGKRSATVLCLTL